MLAALGGGGGLFGGGRKDGNSGGGGGGLACGVACAEPGGCDDPGGCKEGEKAAGEARPRGVCGACWPSSMSFSTLCGFRKLRQSRSSNTKHFSSAVIASSIASSAK